MGLVIFPIIMPQVTINFRGHTPKHPRTQGCVTISIRVPHMGLVISPTIIPQVTLNIRGPHMMYPMIVVYVTLIITGCTPKQPRA
jgi:hypothetical protein